MADNLKPLVIKVRSKSIPIGVAYKWSNLTDQMSTFTKDIITPELGVDKDGNSTVNIGAIVSGMPSIFARANLFKLSIDYITEKEASSTGLMGFYKSLIDEWKGLISCIALDYANIDIERIYLKYSDGKSISGTKNLYEPKGAFGNMLFERKPLWCDQGLAKNEDKIPFIDVIKYKGKVVGGTSPDSFLFTSVDYKLEEKFVFANIQNGKFTDPLNSELTPDQLMQLHGYVSHIISNINKFKDYYKDLPKKLQLQNSNIDGNLTSWKAEIENYANKKGIKLVNSSSPPVDVFLKPFSILFNFSTELYGSEGQISESPDGLENPILFEPRKLLLSKDAEIACINFGNEAAKNAQFLNNQPVFILKAETKGMQGVYHYFALPLSPLGLNIFGKTIGALVGIDQQSAIKSRMSATYDPSSDVNNLKVKLLLFTTDGKEKPLEEVYTVGITSIRGHDILIWPNFISKQWNRYFMYSEIPHNTTSQTCPFKATPFVGDVEDVFFRILMDEEGKPVYLSKDGVTNVSEKFKDTIKAKLHIVSDNRVADNKYKYEIYESNQPFKGVKLAYANKDSGYIIIRYSTQDDKLPNNYLQTTKELAQANLGIDFGSTNSSVAYYSKKENRLVDEIILKNRRVSLFANDNKDNDVRPAMEDEIFFFQNDEIKTNSIKSVMTIHDQKRLVQDTAIMDSAMLVSQAVKGGFPCFEKNLPIESATENRYRLMYPRVGTADIVHNMKWSTQDVENAYKKAYLGSLLLHVYAQLFEDNHVPSTLKWSYPSSMGTNLIGRYIQIWDTLGEVNPINKGAKLKIYKPNLTINYDTSGSSVFGSKTNASGWQNDSVSSEQNNPWPSSTNNPGFNDITQVNSQTNIQGWGNNQQSSNPVFKEIKTETGPIKFNFKQLGSEECLTEACAVANFIVGQTKVQNTIDYLTLSFDVGGSTTDISALCYMIGPSGPGLAMVKQNSIRFAAQRVAHATKVSPNFRAVLLEICEQKKITVQGLNVEPFKYSQETAPYFFEQIVDRLEEQDFPKFYELIRGKCPELMSVNTYVTGLIMFYAGQLAYKLIQEIVKSEDKHPAMTNWKPIVNIVFAGKGARIFDWFKAIDQNASNKYYTDLFISGFGGMNNAQSCLAGPPNINPTNQDGANNIKYEVSKGLALPTESLLVPQNMEAIEILGEEGFVVLNSQGQKVSLPYDSSITNEMMESMGTYFMSSPSPGQFPCPKFMDFAAVFFQVASSLFGLKMTQQDFMNGFQGMNINSYVKTLPEYYAAVESKQKGESKKFDFVAPIIILEGMKFYDDYLLKGIAK